MALMIPLQPEGSAGRCAGSQQGELRLWSQPGECLKPHHPQGAPTQAPRWHHRDPASHNWGSTFQQVAPVWLGPNYLMTWAPHCVMDSTPALLEDALWLHSTPSHRQASSRCLQSPTQTGSSPLLRSPSSTLLHWPPHRGSLPPPRGLCTCRSSLERCSPGCSRRTLCTFPET